MTVVTSSGSAEGRHLPLAPALLAALVGAAVGRGDVLGVPEALSRPRDWETYPELSEPRRERLLELAVDLEVLAGGRVVNRSSDGVTLAYQRSVTHVGHFILTLLTGGLWGFVWMAVILSRKESRVRYEVDPWGNIWPVAAPESACC